MNLDQKIDKLKEPMVKIASQIPARVDINILLAKVREDKKKSKKENLFLICIVFLVIFSTGIILSL